MASAQAHTNTWKTFLFLLRRQIFLFPALNLFPEIEPLLFTKVFFLDKADAQLRDWSLLIAFHRFCYHFSFRFLKLLLMYGVVLIPHQTLPENRNVSLAIILHCVLAIERLYKLGLLKNQNLLAPFLLQFLLVLLDRLALTNRELLSQIGILFCLLNLSDKRALWILLSHRSFRLLLYRLCYVMNQLPSHLDSATNCPDYSLLGGGEETFLLAWRCLCFFNSLSSLAWGDDRPVDEVALLSLFSLKS